MRIFAAIDISGGRCVRLLRGEKGTETVYGQDPVAMALHWEREGAVALHVVDLDAAFGANEKNRTAIESIIDAVKVPVQVGGGVRDIELFERLVALGAARVVFGTAAVEAPDIVRGALALAPEKVVVAVDGREGKVAVRGWLEDSDENPLMLGKIWSREGVGAFIYTDILRDGTLEGPNFDAVRAFVEATGGGVTASGGVSSRDDIHALRGIRGVEAVIIGRALYERKLTVAEANVAAGAAAAAAG